jgi:hypothetical protein
VSRFASGFGNMRGDQRTVSASVPCKST